MRSLSDTVILSALESEAKLDGIITNKDNITVIINSDLVVLEIIKSLASNDNIVFNNINNFKKLINNVIF